MCMYPRYPLAISELGVSESQMFLWLFLSDENGHELLLFKYLIKIPLKVNAVDEDEFYIIFNIEVKSSMLRFELQYSGLNFNIEV